MPKTSRSSQHEGCRENIQSYCARILSIEMFDYSHDHCGDGNLTAYYHAQGARIPPDWNSK